MKYCFIISALLCLSTGCSVYAMEEENTSPSDPCDTVSPLSFSPTSPVSSMQGHSYPDHSGASTTRPPISPRSLRQRPATQLVASTKISSQSSSTSSPTQQQSTSPYDGRTVKELIRDLQNVYDALKANRCSFTAPCSSRLDTVYGTEPAQDYIKILKHNLVIELNLLRYHQELETYVQSVLQHNKALTDENARLKGKHEKGNEHKKSDS